MKTHEIFTEGVILVACYGIALISLIAGDYLAQQLGFPEKSGYLFTAGAAILVSICEIAKDKNISKNHAREAIAFLAAAATVLSFE